MWRWINAALVSLTFTAITALSACSLTQRIQNPVKPPEPMTGTTPEPQIDSQTEAGLSAPNSGQTPDTITISAPIESEPSTQMTAVAVSAPVAAPWSYSGPNGPDHWAELDSANFLCEKGKQQSPMNLVWSTPQKSGGELKLAYQSSQLRLIDTGNSLQVNFEPGSSISIRGQSYELIEMHFHSASEHRLSGKQLPFEIHLMHRDSEGRMAVLALFATLGPLPHAVLEKILQNWPESKNQEVTIADQSLNAISLMPKKLTYYHYMGSLSSPPCTEGVNWNVLNTPIEISKEQLDAFRRHYPDNSRPLQQPYGRRAVNF